MGVGPESVETRVLNMDKLKESKKKEDDGDGEETGCWVKFRFFGSCISSRSKVESSISGSSTRYAESKSTNDTSTDQPVAPVASSSTTSNRESITSTPDITQELKIASQLRKFNFVELKSATRNFRPESLLGEGGFGCVFKGWINESGTTPVKAGTGLTVAVKTLNHDGLQGHKEWLAEVNFLGDLLHPNLVKLIGYCIEDDQRLLVYEFMPRGSLENHLFRRSLPLPWAMRMKIALGAAKGLAFLHEEAERPVIYRDFKTSNILLDADYNAKLSDFGLAKDGPEGDKTHVSTRVMGTYGYAAPEYVMTGAQKAAQLATLCLSRDPKARPLMSEIHEALKPLPNLKDMACSSPYFQTMQSERTGSNSSSRNGSKAQPVRSLSISNSPYHQNQPYRSPKLVG
ncbi:hypothetical protein E3N88_06892 [Mikania micrantha]|uniref:non-specific serine/threonine protein kinase n=1 Tax=Mikania micrantha TaxID=192012 RepID=A0A5N6PRA3_9ASTR|nr:hypothetical protein E3N88_06892 [Mikania micrantha]